MPNPITLPILEALAYLHAQNLTITKLYSTKAANGPPHTHATTALLTAPAPNDIPTDPITASEYQQALQSCVICHEPKTKPGHATCLSVRCLKIFFGKK